MDLEIVSRLRMIFTDELGLEDAQLTDATAYNSLKAWDSLKHLQLISRMESEFDIEIEVRFHTAD